MDKSKQATEALNCRSCFAPLKVRGRTEQGIIECEYCGTENTVSADVYVIALRSQPQFDLALVMAIIEQFSSDELPAICMRVSAILGYRVDHEDAAVGRTFSNKAESLVSYCRRRSIVGELVKAIYLYRPTFDMTVELKRYEIV